MPEFKLPFGRILVCPQNRSKSNAMNHPGYTKEQVLRRGMEMYERDIRPEVEPGHEGEFLAVNALASHKAAR